MNLTKFQFHTIKTKTKYGYLKKIQRLDKKPDVMPPACKMIIEDALSDHTVNVIFSYADNKELATHVAIVLFEKGNELDDNKYIILRPLKGSTAKILLSAPAPAFQKHHQYLKFDTMAPKQ